MGPDKKEVAVKALSLRASRAWKQVELFEREARALQGLQHPGIPKYIEYFQADTPEDREFYLVQVCILDPSLDLPYHTAPADDQAGKLRVFTALSCALESALHKQLQNCCCLLPPL